MGGFTWSARTYYDASTASSDPYPFKEVTCPPDKIVKWQTIYVKLTTEDAARTSNPRAAIQLVDARAHPASSSDVLGKFISPIAQPKAKTYYYVFSQVPYHGPSTASGAELLATDHIMVPIPELIFSTSQKIQFLVTDDTGADDDSIISAAYLIADRAGGPG